MRGESAGGPNMHNKLALVTVVGIGLLTSSAAEALPLLSARPSAPAATMVESVKVVCDEQGRCYRPPGRRPTARWVYGDKNFYGPYVGPGYYGDPRYRYSWWPFW